MTLYAVEARPLRSRYRTPTSCGELGGLRRYGLEGDPDTNNNADVPDGAPDRTTLVFCALTDEVTIERDGWRQGYADSVTFKITIDDNATNQYP